MVYATQSLSQPTHPAAWQPETEMTKAKTTTPAADKPAGPEATTPVDTQAAEAQAQATPPDVKDAGDGSTAKGPNVAATSEITSNTNPVSREPGDTSGPDNLPASAETSGEPSPEQAAIQPVLDASNNSAEVKDRARVALGNAGETPKPTMVNGVYVGGKIYDEASDSYVDDPDAVADPVRAEDIFDRIGNAFMHERQRMVIEEIARFVGMDGDNTQSLPDGLPSSKSTASLRTDVSGYGGYASGGPGPRPIPAGKDGQPQVGDQAEQVDTTGKN